MTQPNPNTPPAPPSLADLMVRFLNRPAADLPLGEVEPYEVASGHRVEPRLAWQEAVAALALLNDKAPATINPPGDWAALVNRPESESALPFAAGSYPQHVRDLMPLLQANDLTALRPRPDRAGEASVSSTLRNWVAHQTRTSAPAQVLLAAGVLRLANDHDQASRLLNQHRSQASTEWHAAWANEEAALLWTWGRAEEADALWQQQPESVPVLFNRGMAALFLGRSGDARVLLARVVSRLPENGAWHHLGRLYLALAEMRG